MKELEILYKDEQILVINKPSGLIIHKTAISSDRDSVVDRLKSHFENPPFPVHRLDRPTSGILVCAFSEETASMLSAYFRDGKIKKTYKAVVRGWVESSGEIDIPLKNYDTGKMQEARTRYIPEKTYSYPWPNRKYAESRYSFINVFPLSGRMHQIRRHLARANNPIVGDTSHGDTDHNHAFRDYFGIDRLLLHASSIEFPYPDGNSLFKLESPIGDDFLPVLQRMNKEAIVKDYALVNSDRDFSE